MKAQPRGAMVPLALLNSRLAALTGEVPPGYSKVLRSALDGALPARRLGGRWFVAEVDLEAAAAVLGMSAPTRPVRHARRKQGRGDRCARRVE